jgi:hypothetical protein
MNSARIVFGTERKEKSCLVAETIYSPHNLARVRIDCFLVLTASWSNDVTPEVSAFQNFLIDRDIEIPSKTHWKAIAKSISARGKDPEFGFSGVAEWYRFRDRIQNRARKITGNRNPARGHDHDSLKYSSEPLEKRGKYSDIYLTSLKASSNLTTNE